MIQLEGPGFPTHMVFEEKNVRQDSFLLLQNKAGGQQTPTLTLQLLQIEEINSKLHNRGWLSGIIRKGD